LRRLIKLYCGNGNHKGVAIELSIGRWARTDGDAVASVARVDVVPVRKVGALLTTLGFFRDWAEAQAFLLYSFLFG
jgi:hypothetical protein